MSLRKTGALSQVKQEEQTHAIPSGNGSLVERSLASRIHPLNPYPRTTVHHSPPHHHARHYRSSSPPILHTNRGADHSPQRMDGLLPATISSLLGSSLSGNAPDTSLNSQAMSWPPPSEGTRESLDGLGLNPGLKLELRLQEEKDARKRADSEADALRSQLSQARERENHLGRELERAKVDIARYEGDELHLASKLVEANKEIEQAERQLEEARRLLSRYDGNTSGEDGKSLLGA
jgi:hypothetical protein